MKTAITNLTHKLESVYNGQPWYGESLLQKLERVGPAEAFAIPVPGAHNIAQIVAHLTGWRRVLSERLKGNMEYQLDVDSDADWAPVSALQQKGWSTILAELAENQHELLSFLASGTDEFLHTVYSGTDTYESLIEGVIQHDIYHTGQIGLLMSANKNAA